MLMQPQLHWSPQCKALDGLRPCCSSSSRFSCRQLWMARSYVYHGGLSPDRKILDQILVLSSSLQAPFVLLSSLKLTISTWSLNRYDYCYWYFVCSALAWLLRWRESVACKNASCKKPFAHSQEIWGRTLFIVAVILCERCLLCLRSQSIQQFLDPVAWWKYSWTKSISRFLWTYADWFADPYNAPSSSWWFIFYSIPYSPYDKPEDLARFLPIHPFDPCEDYCICNVCMKRCVQTAKYLSSIDNCSYNKNSMDLGSLWSFANFLWQGKIVLST